MLTYSMKKIEFVIIIAVAILLSLLALNSYSLEKHDLDCSKCHTLTNEEAYNVIKQVIPDSKIIEVRSSPMKGLWEIALESKGTKGLLYLDYSKKLAFNGSIFEIKSNTNLTQKRYMEINKVDVSQIPLDDAIIMGNKEAKYKVIVFDDPA